MLKYFEQLAAAGCRCDYGLFVAGTKDNVSTVVAVAEEAAGLKMYLNETFAMLKLDSTLQWMQVYFAIKLFCVRFHAVCMTMNCWGDNHLKKFF